jgi:hypothetical protein
MPTYNTKQLIKKLEEQTETFLQKAIFEWQMTSPTKLLKQPGEKKWSAAQCLEHLNSYGHYYLPAIEKAIAKAQQNNQTSTEEFTAGWLGNYFTKLMEPDTNGKKMKKMSAPKNHTPVADLDSDKVLREFIDQQEKMLTLLEKAKTINLEQAKVAISIAKFIKLKLGDVFTFLIAHNHRHVVQAERALAAAPALKGEERTSCNNGEKTAVVS